MTDIESFYSLDTNLLHFPYTKWREATEQQQVDNFQELYLHELTHWYQHHGTSFGAFISSIKSALNHHCKDALLSLNEHQRRYRAEKRRAGTPILPLFDNGAPNLRLFTDSEQTWTCKSTKAQAGPVFYYLATCDFMFRCYSHVNQHLAPGQIVCSALHYVEHYLAARGAIRTIASDEILKFEDKLTEQFSPLWYSSVSHGSGSSRTPIDTEDLFESCAILIEIIYILYWYKGEESVQPLRAKLTRAGTNLLGGTAALGRVHGLLDKYIAPISYASIIFDEPMLVKFSPDEKAIDNWDFFGENAPTLIAAIEVALNPPLPPRFTLDLDRLSWADIYPPLRYGLCLQAVREVGKLRLTSGTNRSDVIDYMQSLAEAAGISYGKPNNLAEKTDIFDRCVSELAKTDNVDCDEDGQRDRADLESRLYGQFDLFDFTDCCQRNFSRIQSSDGEGLIVDMMLACFRGALPHHDQVPKIKTESRRKYLVPPVVIDTSDDRVRAGSEHWTGHMPYWLVLKSLEESAIFDLICSTGEPAFDARLMAEEREHLRRRASNIFGIQPW